MNEETEEITREFDQQIGLSIQELSNQLAIKTGQSANIFNEMFFSVFKLGYTAGKLKGMENDGICTRTKK